MYINDCENSRIFHEIIIEYIAKPGSKRKEHLDFLRYIISVFITIDIYSKRNRLQIVAVVHLKLL